MFGAVWLHQALRRCWERRPGIALDVFLGTVERKDLNTDWGDQQLVRI